MTVLETVALDQRRWATSALKLKDSNWARFRLMAGLSLLGAVLEAIAVQIHVAYPVASQTAGFAGAAALALVLVVRSKGLSRERAQAWVLAAAAGQSVKSEMYRYRTSCGPYSERRGGNPDTTLLRRRDAIFEKVKLIEKYIVEPESKPLPPLGPLDADAYIAERVDGQTKMFQKYSKDLPEIQAMWLRIEYILAGVAALAAVVLAFTHSQAYSAWVIVIAFLSVALGAATKLERYATLTVELQTMPPRLTSILERWHANHGSLEQLVDQIEAAVLAEAEAWVAVLDDDALESSASAIVKESSLEPVLNSPVSRASA